MLLRHTATALSLAATLAVNGAGAPLNSTLGVSPTTAQGAPFGASANVRITADNEVGRGPATVCLGCIAAGVVTIATSGWLGVWTLFMVGGSGAVAAGGAVATCTAACVAYLAED